MQWGTRKEGVHTETGRQCVSPVVISTGRNIINYRAEYNHTLNKEMWPLEDSKDKGKEEKLVFKLSKLGFGLNLIRFTSALSASWIITENKIKCKHD